MIDLTPVVSILGRLIFTLGALMFLPAGLDLAIGNGNAAGFATAFGAVTVCGVAGVLVTCGPVWQPASMATLSSVTTLVVILVRILM